MEEFEDKLAEILEVEELSPNDVLQECENWDSLTVLSIVAMLDSSYGVSLPAADLRRIKTVGELVAVVKARSGK